MHELFKTDAVIFILLSSFLGSRGFQKVKEIIKFNKEWFTFFLNLICLLWIFDGVWILQLVSSETTAAARSSKAAFKHCPKIKKKTYTGPSEMLELISSACIHNNMRYRSHCPHWIIWEVKQNKGRKDSLKTSHKKFGKPLQLAFCEERGENFFWKKKPQCPNFLCIFLQTPFQLKL